MMPTRLTAAAACCVILFAAATFSAWTLPAIVGGVAACIVLYVRHTRPRSISKLSAPKQE
jgi:hypothetical protein